MRRKILVAALAAVLVIATAGAAGAITWGVPDGEGHPNVVQLLFVQNGEGYYGCSGTLLTPTLVLTAGHCTGWVDEYGVQHSNDGKTYVTNVPDIWALYDSTRGDYGSTPEWLEGEWVSGDATPHPMYSEFSQFPLTYDIGLVELDDPIYVDTYGEMPELNQFEYLKTAKGAPSKRMVEVVGYGLLGKIPPFTSDAWDREYGYSTIINTGASANVGPQNFMFTNNPGMGSGVGGTCSGDSGGPAFWVDPGTGEATNVVLAVNSYGIAPLCNGNDYQFRTDTEVAQDFVGPFLP